MSPRALTVLCALAFLIPRAHAQSAQPSIRGAWVGAGIGIGSARVGCDICSGDRNSGLTARLGAGIRAAPGLMLGAEVNGWFDETDVGDQQVDQSLTLFAATAIWYPNVQGRWHLRSGLGLLRYSSSTGDQDDESLEASAIGVLLNVGYDVRLSDRFWLTPYGGFTVSTNGDLKSGNTVVESASFSVFQIGAGLSWRK